MTLPPSTEPHGEDESMSLPEASHAKTSALPEKARASTADGAAFGGTCTGSFAILDRDGSGWRTAQRSLNGGWIEFCGRWPKSGTMRSGACSARDMSEHLTDATASGSSLPTPTPTANLYETKNLQGLLDRRERCKIANKNGNGFGLTLAQHVAVHMTNYDPAMRLNAEWVEELMGWPRGWTEVPPDFGKGSGKPSRE